MFNRIIYVLLLVISGLGFGVCQQTGEFVTGENLDSGEEAIESLIECAENNFVISGPGDIINNKLIEYSVESKDGSYPNYIKSATFSLLLDGEIKEVFTGIKYIHNFVGIDQFVLQADIVDSLNCSYTLEKAINVYSGIVLYIGENENALKLGFESNFNKNNILYKKLFIEDKNFFSQDEFIKKLSVNIFYLKNADKVVFDSSKFSSMFEMLGKAKDLYNLELSTKQIFIVTEMNQNLLKRLLAKYLNLMGITRIYVVKNENLLNLMSSLSNLDDTIEEKYVERFTLEINEVSKIYFLSYVIDYLIYNGFPISLIVLILGLSVTAMVVSVFRQIIGFSVFGVTSPILFAITMIVLGIKLSLILLFIAFIATYLTRKFTRIIYLLYSPKISMLIILYVIVSLLVFWLDMYFGLKMIDYSVFNNSLIIFPIIVLVVIANKVFYEGFSLFSKGWWFSFIEFLIVSYVVYFLIGWDTFQHFLLSLPEIIIVVLIINILVGRFSGLQLLEYIRFLPLLRKHMDEEE